MIEKIFCYIRYPFALVGALLLVVIFSLLGLAAAIIFSSPRPGSLVVLTFSRILFFLIGGRLEISGRENIPDEGAIFLFNHSSHLDIPALCSAVGLMDLRFGAKKELFKVPFLGWIMALNGTLPIQRGNREEVLRLYQESVPKVKAGVSYALAPEGTRGDGVRLQKFKSGPFIFALSGNFKIVPVVIAGLPEILPRKSLLLGCRRWRQKVIVRILPPMITEGLSLEDRTTLADEAHQKMSVAYTEGLEKLGLNQN